MSSLISDLEKVELTGILSDHFDTFSRNIIVYKTPIANSSIDINSTNLAGYNSNIQYPNITYTIVSGIYPAIRMNKNDNPVNKIDEIKSVVVGEGKIRIKIKEDAMRFIELGGNEYVDVDGFKYNFSNRPYTQNYLGLVYYIYHLEAIE
jgi:hypothetical protein